MVVTTGFLGEILWDASKPDGTPKKQFNVSRLAAQGQRVGIPLEDGLGATVELFCEQIGSVLVSP